MTVMTAAPLPDSRPLHASGEAAPKNVHGAEGGQQACLLPIQTPEFRV